MTELIFCGKLRNITCLVAKYYLAVIYLSAGNMEIALLKLKSIETAHIIHSK